MENHEPDLQSIIEEWKQRQRQEHYGQHRLDFRRDTLMIWREQIQEAFPRGVPLRATWKGTTVIQSILHAFSGRLPNERGNTTNLYMPASGDIALGSAEIAAEENMIALQSWSFSDTSGSYRLLRPDHLAFVCPPGSDGHLRYDWAYLWLKLKEIAPTDVYDEDLRKRCREYGYEPLCEIRPGEYVDVEYAQEGGFTNEHGEWEDLPTTAREVKRLLGGSMILVCKGGPYNLLVKRLQGIPDPDEGLHEHFGQQQFLRFVGELARRADEKELGPLVRGPIVQ